MPVTPAQVVGLLAPAGPAVRTFGEGVHVSTADSILGDNALEQQRQTEHSAACRGLADVEFESCKVQIIKLGKSHSASRIIFRRRRPK